MTSFELREKKMELIRRMEEICGKEYTFGWLKSAYMYTDGNLEEDVLNRAFSELERLAAKK